MSSVQRNTCLTYFISLLPIIIYTSLYSSYRLRNNKYASFIFAVEKLFTLLLMKMYFIIISIRFNCLLRLISHK